MQPGDLPKLRLDEVSRYLMKIMPYDTVNNPRLQDIVVAALKTGKPVYPADFEKQFPGKRPGEIPTDQLLAFYASHLKAEAIPALEQLNAVVKEAKIPESLMKTQRELARLKCGLVIYREYLNACWTPELMGPATPGAHLDPAADGIKFS